MNFCFTKLQFYYMDNIMKQYFICHQLSLLN